MTHSATKAENYNRSMTFLLFSFFYSADLCPCFALPENFKNVLSTMMDFSLLKDPVFLLIGISNVFGMAGLYVPFVYLVDAAVLSVSIAVFLINLFTSLL